MQQQEVESASWKTLTGSPDDSIAPSIEFAVRLKARLPEPLDVIETVE